MLFRWMPVPGTITPEPEPVEAVSDAAFPAASTTEMCVVPRSPCSGTPAQAGTDAAQRRPHVLLPVEAPREPAAVELRREAALAGAPLLAHHLGEPRHRRRRALRLRRAERVDEPQPVADQDAARRGRRVGDELVPAEPSPHRPPPHHAERGEICTGDSSALCAQVADDLLPERAAVDRGRALAGELLERRPEVVQDEAVARAETRAAAVDPPPLVRVAQDQVEDAVQVRLRRGQLDAVPRKLERRPEQARPRQRAERPVRRLEARRRPGHRARARRRSGRPGSCRRRSRCRSPSMPARRGTRGTEARGGDEEVEQAVAAVARAVDEHEPARARAGERALGDPGGERGGDAGVDGVAALGEHARARLGRQRMAGCNRALHARSLGGNRLLHEQALDVITVASTTSSSLDRPNPYAR